MSLGGDADTIAAMTGALAGATLGEQAIPLDWRERLEDLAGIEAISESLASLSARELPRDGGLMVPGDQAGQPEEQDAETGPPTGIVASRRPTSRIGAPQEWLGSGARACWPTQATKCRPRCFQAFSRPRWARLPPRWASSREWLTGSPAPDSQVVRWPMTRYGVGRRPLAATPPWQFCPA